MATKRQSIISWSSRPDESEKVWFEPQNVQLDDDTYTGLVLVFNDSETKDSLHGRFAVPQDYDSAAKVVINWAAAAAGTGDRDVVFDLSYRTVDAGEDLDGSATDATDSVTTAAPESKGELVESVITATEGDFAAGDEVQFIVSRDGTAADELSADVLVVGVYFEYSDGA